MTQEEYEREQREIEDLVRQINALIAENNRLVAEINSAISDISVLRNNIGVLHKNIEPIMQNASAEVGLNAEKTQMVNHAIQELTEQYFSFKTLSSASKNLSQYTDEYYTRFSYYQNLRRITLGYIIGLDTEFVSNETMRGIVEKAYLQNTEYWLAYATMAMMLWASNEKEAAERALNKALFIEQTKAAMYFMLVNLRFGRTDTAKEWFLYYMDRVDASDLGDEWQYLLQAYLTGVFGQDSKFEESVQKHFKTLLSKAEATTVDFGKKFSDRAERYADAYLHRTNESFPHLKQTCAGYPEILDILSAAEKNELFAKLYDDLAAEEDHSGDDIAQRVENVLYNLVNSYDKAELEVVKKIRYNDAIMSAQGNVSEAQKKYDDEFGSDNKKETFADLMVKWAFTEDSNLVSVTTRRFSISFMKDWILKGYERYARSYREKEKASYTFDIDGCGITCNEEEFETGKQKIAEHYSRNKVKNILMDKMTLIYLLITVCGLATLGIMGVQLAGGYFSKVALVIGILLVLVGVFLVWRQVVALLEMLKEKERLSVQKFRHSLTELGEWRRAYYEANSRFADLEKALKQFGTEIQ